MIIRKKIENYCILISIIALVSSFITVPYEVANTHLDNKIKKTLISITEDQNQTNPASKGIKIGGNPYAIAVNPKSNMIYVVDKYYKKISFIDGDSDKVVRTVIIPSNKTHALSKYNLTDFSSAIAIDGDNNLLYVTNSGSDIVSVLDGSDGNKVIDKIVDGSPRAVIATEKGSQIFVLTNNNMILTNNTVNESLNNMVYLVNGFYSRIDYKIPVGQGVMLTSMAVDSNSTTVYVGGQSGNPTVHVIDHIGPELYNSANIALSTDRNDIRDIGVDSITRKTYIANGDQIFVTNSTKEIPNAKLTLGGPLRSIAVTVNKNASKIYVGILPNLVSVINGSTNKPYKNITVGEGPRDIAVNPKTKRIYVANFNSGTISVINGSSDKVIAGVTFKVNPAGSGNIICNNQRISRSYTRYDIGTSLICKADPNSGFQFSSWSSDFDLINSGSISSVFDFIYYSLFGNTPYFTNFTVSKYGTLSANFVNLTTIPTEFWTPFYALIPAFIGSTFIPSIVHSVKLKRTQNRNLKEYLDKIGKVDKNKIEEEIAILRTNGEISKLGYNRLKDEISKHYKDEGTAMPHGVQ